MIQHGKLQAPTGNRQLVVVPEMAPGETEPRLGTSDTVPLLVDLLQWDTDEREPQELEVFIYPLFRADDLEASMDCLPLFFVTRVEIAWSGGAGAVGSSQRHSTTQLTPAGFGVPDEYAGRALPIRGLPDHGMRVRLACRSLRVRLWVVAAPVAFVVVGSIQPVTGGASGEVVPPVVLLEAFPKLIPYGAREFRVAAFPRTGGVFNPDCVIRLNACRVPHVLGSEIEYLARDCVSWQLLPGESVSFQTLVEAFGTIEFR